MAIPVMYIYIPSYTFLERVNKRKREKKKTKRKQKLEIGRDTKGKKIVSGEEKIARESTHNVSRGCIGRRKVVGTVSPVVNSVNVEFKPEKSSYYGISEMIDRVNNGGRAVGRSFEEREIQRRGKKRKEWNDEK